MTLIVKGIFNHKMQVTVVKMLIPGFENKNNLIRQAPRIPLKNPKTYSQRGSTHRKIERRRGLVVKSLDCGAEGPGIEI